MISQSTIAPVRVIASLDALPQISAAGGATLWAKPYRSLDDPATYAAKKPPPRHRVSRCRDWRRRKFRSRCRPRRRRDGKPPQITFDGTSNAQCGVASGFTVTPADQGLAVGDTTIGVLQGINICLSVFTKQGVLQPGYPKSAKTFFGLGAGVANSDPRMIYDWITTAIFMYSFRLTAPAAMLIAQQLPITSSPSARATIPQAAGACIN